MLLEASLWSLPVAPSISEPVAAHESLHVLGVSLTSFATSFVPLASESSLLLSLQMIRLCPPG